MGYVIYFLVAVAFIVSAYLEPHVNLSVPLEWISMTCVLALIIVYNLVGGPVKGEWQRVGPYEVLNLRKTAFFAVFLVYLMVKDPLPILSEFWAGMYLLTAAGCMLTTLRVKRV